MFLPRSVGILLAAGLGSSGAAAEAADAAPVVPPAVHRFDFGDDAAPAGWNAVTPESGYTRERGFGLEAEGRARVVASAGDGSVRADSLAPEAQAYFFSVAVPEGNYRVTVTLGDTQRATETTVKAELRRLMLERVTTRPGEFASRSFVVNVRTPVITARGGSPAGKVRLKAPRETTQEAWAWDPRLTLEFNGAEAAVCAVEIEPVDVPTIFLLGDSTVCDQSREPFASWGQMMPRFLDERVAVANHGESGETYRDSLARGRIDKIASVLRPGDWVLLQFGHNDQKQIDQGTGGPFTTYRDEIARHIAIVRAVGGVPVIVSPMERRGFDAAGKVVRSLRDYAEAARMAAQEAGAAFIDLNAASIPLYEALGAVDSARAFAAPDGKQDNTHHNNYGAYEIAKCVVQAARAQQLPFAEFVRSDFAEFSPARPDDLTRFQLPPSPLVTKLRPLGD